MGVWAVAGCREEFLLCPGGPHTVGAAVAKTQSRPRGRGEQVLPPRWLPLGFQVSWLNAAWRALGHRYSVSQWGCRGGSR